MVPRLDPMIVSTDGERLAAFYRELLGAVETVRQPAEGPAFYLGLELGGTRLGIVCDAGAQAGPQRFLLSAELDSAADVDVLLPRVRELGGTAEGEANNMPWGQRVAHVTDPDGNTLNLAGPIA
ncbi:VOC family protein [Pseudonocardia nematodicida]|uniref:VOC family protein n=1 Tax=Pseudonocardia nematodicida TaxID=1206997 RepID=A0ABV1KJS4_9PSEU